MLADSQVNGFSKGYGNGAGFGANGTRTRDDERRQRHRAGRHDRRGSVGRRRHVDAHEDRGHGLAARCARPRRRAYGAGFYGQSDGHGSTNVDANNNVTLGDGAQIIGWEGVDLIANYNHVNTDAYGFSRATGLFGHVDADGDNDTTLDATVTGSTSTSTHALVVAGPRDDSASNTDLGAPDAATRTWRSSSTRRTTTSSTTRTPT